MNIKNRTIFTSDCLHTMRGMADECIDLIYLDPPFNSNANYAAPVGSEAAGAEFKDTWGLSDIDLAWHGEIAEKSPGLYELLTATRSIHGDSMMSYLIYMAIRIMEMKRVLKDTGSIYLHCDPTASHYLKLMMDAVFGRASFRSQIAWKRSSAHSDTRQGRRQHGRIQDNIFCYTKGKTWTWNPQHTPYDESYVERNYRHIEEGTGRRYRLDNLTGPGGAAKGNPKYEVMGVIRHWRYSKEKMQDLIASGRIIQTAPGRVPAYKRYLDEMPGIPLQDIWNDIAPIQSASKERIGYPTQKPISLLQRIIKTSSNQDDLILDPFCGCATTCVAAEVESRQWIGIDVSEKAFQLVKMRLEKTLPAMDWQVIHRTDIPSDRKGKKSKNIKHIRYGEQEGRCNGCMEHFPFKNMTEDHKIPKARGGADTDDNIQLLCNWCNSKKGHRMTHDELVAVLIEEGVRK